MRIRTLLVALLTVTAMTATADAGNYVLHLQGRSQGSWTDDVSGLGGTGWTNITIPFDGNAKLQSNTTNVTVRNAIRDYCDNGNTCIVHCYSTGCLRASKAIDDIRNGYDNDPNANYDLDGLLYMQGSSSAAGGTELAEISTQGLTKYIAKLLGQQEAVDFDLVPAAARGTWGYTHDQIGVNFWHAGGNKDVCKGFWIFKICGGWFIPGKDDGVVPWHSSGGFSSSSSRSSLCSSDAAGELVAGNVPGKYPYHRTDVFTYQHQCGGGSWDHFGIPDFGAEVLEMDIKNVTSGSFQYRAWSDPGVEYLDYCSGADCDEAFATCVPALGGDCQDFTVQPDGTGSGASNVNSSTSNTTDWTGSSYSCMGKCGSYAGACWCDDLCESYGDCCSDFGAANCSAVLN